MLIGWKKELFHGSNQDNQKDLDYAIDKTNTVKMHTHSMIDVTALNILLWLLEIGKPVGHMVHTLMSHSEDMVLEHIIETVTPWSVSYGLNKEEKK